MPPRRGTGRGNSQRGQPDTQSKAAPPKARSSVTNYRPLEDPNDGVTQAYRADRGLIPSDGWGHIQYIEGRDVHHDQYHCTERQQITAPTKYKRRCRHCFEIAKSHCRHLLFRRRLLSRRHQPNYWLLPSSRDRLPNRALQHQAARYPQPLWASCA